MFKDTRAKHVILFHLPPRYGYESILQHVYRKSLNKWQVHVTGNSIIDQMCGSSVSGCTNTDPALAQWIHACTHERRGSNQPLLKSLPCQAGDFEVCQIKPSTMYFTQSKMSCLEAAGQERLVSVTQVIIVALSLVDKMMYCQGGSNYRVCYSNYASMAELETFVRHFSPLQITPCAIPPHSSRDEVREVLTSFLTNPDIVVNGDTGDNMWVWFCDHLSINITKTNNQPCIDIFMMFAMIHHYLRYDSAMTSPASSTSPVSRKRKHSGAGSDTVSDAEVMHNVSISQVMIIMHCFVRLRRDLPRCWSWSGVALPVRYHLMTPWILTERQAGSSQVNHLSTTLLFIMFICDCWGHDEPDSNDEDDVRERYRVEIVPTTVLAGSECSPGSSTPASSCVSSDRRAMFAKSKSVKTCYSMPVPVSNKLRLYGLILWRVINVVCNISRLK